MINGLQYAGRYFFSEANKPLPVKISVDAANTPDIAITKRIGKMCPKNPPSAIPAPLPIEVSAPIVALTRPRSDSMLFRAINGPTKILNAATISPTIANIKAKKNKFGA